MRKLTIGMCLLTAPAWGIVNWANPNGGDYTDPANWLTSGGASVTSIEYGVPGADASTQFGGSVFPLGGTLQVYLPRNFAVDRLVMNAMSRTVDLDLRDHTLTLKANVSSAMKANTSGGTLRIHDGTVLCDYSGEGNNAVDWASDTSTAVKNTLIVDNATLRMMNLNFLYGDENHVVITNGGKLDVSYVNFTSVKNSGVTVVGDTSTLAVSKGIRKMHDSYLPFGGYIEIIGSPTVSDSFYGASAGDGFRRTLLGGTHSLSSDITVGSGAAMSNRFEVLDGAKVTTSGRVWTGPSSGLGSGNMTLVSGPGSRLVSTSPYLQHLGNNSRNNMLAVENGGYFEVAASVRIGSAGGTANAQSHGNTLRVSGAGSLFVTKNVGEELSVGYGSLCAVSNNAMYVLDGGTVTNAGKLIVGYNLGSHDNALVISNGTLCSRSFVIGNAGYGNRFVIEGSNAVVKAYPGSDGIVTVGAQIGSSNNVMTVRDTNLTFPSLVKIGDADVNNVLVIERATMKVPNGTFAMGGEPVADQQPGRATVVMTDSVLEILRSRTYGPDNAIVLTNSTVRMSDGGIPGATTSEGRVDLPYTQEQPFRLTIAGASSRLEAPEKNCGLRLGTRSRLHFVLGTEGFARAPLAADGTLEILSESVTLEDEGAFKPGAFIPLFEADTIEISDELKASILAQCPAHCRWKQEGEVLGIRVSKQTGLLLMVR